MESLEKKVGYLKGLMEGMDFSDDPSKGKLLTSMVELLGDLSDRVEGIGELLDDLNEYVESIDDDLAELEGGHDDDFHMIDDDEFEDEYYDEDDEDGEDHLHVLGGKAKDADEDEAETLAGSICPECGHMFFVALDDPEDARYDCPHCGKRVTPTPLTPENAPIAHPAVD